MKKINWKKVITAGVTLVSAAALFVAANAVKPTHVNAASNDATVSAIKKRGQLRVAVSVTFHHMAGLTKMVSVLVTMLN